MRVLNCNSDARNKPLCPFMLQKSLDYMVLDVRKWSKNWLAKTIQNQYQGVSSLGCKHLYFQ